MDLRNESIQGSALGGTVFSTPAASPVVMPVSVAAPYGGYNNGFGNGLETIALLSLLGGKGGFGFGNSGYGNPFNLLNAQNGSDTRYEIAKSESEVKENTSNEVRALSHEISDVRENSIAAKYEGIIAAKDSTYAVTNRIERETDQLRMQNFIMSNQSKDQFFAIQKNIDDKLCHLEHENERRFSAIKEREDAREIASLRAQIDGFTNNSLLAATSSMVSQNANMMKLLEKISCALPECGCLPLETPITKK